MFATGQTPLLFAIAKQRVNVVRLLLHYCANVSMKGKLYAPNPCSDVEDSSNCIVSPLEAACSVKCWEIVELLLCYNISVADELPGSWKTLLKLAIQQDTDQLLDILLKFSPMHFCEKSELTRLLFSSVKKGEIPIVRKLLQLGANPNDIQHSCNLLLLAAKNYNFALYNVLLQGGALLDIEKSNVLHFYAQCGNVDGLRFFIEKCNMSPSFLDAECNTLLHSAVSTRKLEIIEYLLTVCVKRGIDVINLLNVRNKHNATIYDIYFSEFATEWLSELCFVKVRLKDELHLEFVKLVCKWNPSLTEVTMLMKTFLLWVAIKTDCFEIVCFLVKAGIFVNKQYYTHKSLLSESIIGVGSGKCHMDIVKLLIDAGARINMASSDGILPLHLALSYSNIELVCALNNAGANWNLLDRHKQSSLHWAIKSMSPEILCFCLERSIYVNRLNADGLTPLCYLLDIQSNGAGMNLSRKKPATELCELLIKAGSKLNTSRIHKFCLTPYETCDWDSVMLLELLIIHGAIDQHILSV